MNILVVCPYGLYSDLSFSFVHNQIREYAKLGHRVRALILNGLGKTGYNGARVFPLVGEAAADGVELRYVRYLTASKYGEKRFNTQMAIAAIAAQEKRLLGDFRPDVIHTQTLGFASDIGAWLKVKYGCPLVVTTHGTDMFHPIQCGNGLYLRRQAEKADTVIAVSSLLRNTLRKTGIDGDIRIILNGFRTDGVCDPKDERGISLLQVGFMIPRKKGDVTLRAFSLIRRKYPDAVLTFVGDGPERKHLEVLAQELDVRDSVHFLGKLPNPDTLAQMAKAKFFVLPSIDEAFGIVYSEAMASGCLTIGTEGEGIEDLIRHGENGYLVPADDPQAIAQVVDACVRAPEKARIVAGQGRQDALELTWERNAGQYLALFRELTGGKNGGKRSKRT